MLFRSRNLFIFKKKSHEATATGRTLPGIMEAVRRRGAEKNPHALLSRGLAGVVECAGVRAVVINAPGSTGGASDTIEVAGPLLRHLVEQLDGADH